MLSILKSVSLCILAMLGSYFSFQTACVPFPASKLPSPQVLKVEIPENALIFSDGAVGRLQIGWYGHEGTGAMKTITPAEWYEQAKSNDPSVCPVMIFSRSGYVDLAIFQRGGGLSGSSSVAIAHSVQIEGFVSWPFSFRWEIGTKTIEVDRNSGVVTYRPNGEAGASLLFFLLAGSLLFLVFVITGYDSAEKICQYRRHSKYAREQAGSVKAPS